MWAEANNKDLLIGVIGTAGLVLVALIGLAAQIWRRGREHAGLHELVAKIDERTELTHDMLHQHITDHSSHVTHRKERTA